MKKYYEDEYIIIYNSDSLSILDKLPEFNVMLTDPPYPNDKRFPCKWELISEFASLSYDIAPDNTWFVSDFSKSYLCEWLKHFQPWQYVDIVAAHVSNSMAMCRFGFDIFIPSLIMAKGKPKVFKKWSNLIPAIRESNGVQWGHPSPKYVSVYSRYIAMLLPEDGLLIDPFMGSGTSMVAYKLLNRKGIGIEINEEYCKIAVERLSQCVLPLFGTQETEVIENTSTNTERLKC